MSQLSLLAVGVVVLGQSVLRADEATYPRSALLIEPTELAKPDVAKNYVVLDARDNSKYRASHIPNARWVDQVQWAKAFDHGQDAAGWGKRIGGLGIGADAKVIVYDGTFSRDAARVWWILRYWGVEDVRILNGGWMGWKAGRHPTEDAETVPVPVKFAAIAHRDRLATKEQLLDSLKTGRVQIVDARSVEEFCGDEKLTNKRGGAIPGAKHLEWIDLLDKQTQRFKSAADLQRIFGQAGIALDKPSAAHCQSGGRAAVMAFGMELMGAKDVSNYYPSWSEWSNAADTPVVPGKVKK
jgi:thiosulfate/3-mercaptopyruvate sulfurtransferase